MPRGDGTGPPGGDGPESGRGQGQGQVRRPGGGAGPGGECVCPVCGPTLACGSMLTELITGKTVREALRIDDSGIKAMLGGLPAEHEHCAELAVDTLHDALRRYLAHKRTPWKRLYENPE